MTDSVEEFRATIASIDGRLEEVRRSRHREFELGYEGMAAVTRRRFPTADRLHYVNHGDGDSRYNFAITSISDAAGNALWVDEEKDWDATDRFTKMLHRYAYTLEFADRHDVFFDLDDLRSGWPALVLPPDSRLTVD